MFYYIYRRGGIDVIGFIFWLYYVYTLFVVSIFAGVSTSQYWLLGNLIFNADQAKRLFGLIGSGSIAGAALGGYFSSGISMLGGAQEVSILVGFLLLICIPLTRRLVKLNEINDSQKSPEIDFSHRIAQCVDF